MKVRREVVSVFTANAIDITKICAVVGAFGGAVAAAFGGWDAALSTLVIFMIIDYMLGIIVAAFFKKSKKSKTGALDSNAGWKGLLKKGVTLLVVLVACRLELVTGISFIRDAVVIAYIANETISITENAGLMGIPIPAPIQRAIDILKTKSEKEVVENAEKHN